ncbi:hypothetical protein Syun_026763 [Stephania yunnanensis]|uniref:Uncharacterized protein n=1 Tax=Stephania yunnanensis TaxID=152371 RepID=A0AAP0EHN8_9MAGN
MSHNDIHNNTLANRWYCYGFVHVNQTLSSLTLEEAEEESKITCMITNNTYRTL